MPALAYQAVLALVVLAALSGTCEGRRRPKYVKGDAVPLFANKVGPFANPTETYQFYDLPFCAPLEGKEYKLEGLGEVLQGDRLVSTPHKLKFREDVPLRTLCHQTLWKEELDVLREAVARDYYFQMYLDDLPLWGFLGKEEQRGGGLAPKGFLFTHLHFELLYNGSNIIQVDVSTDSTKALEITNELSLEVGFTYSARWQPTDVIFKHRMRRYRQYSFLPQHLNIHWFAIINSCVTVLLLTGVLAVILLRVLKNDFLRYNALDAESLKEGEEAGWKVVSGDVFRPPPDLGLFCAVVGTGTQLLLMAFCVLGLALLNTYAPHRRGAMLTSCVLLYVLTAGVAGYASGSLYKQLGGVHWVRICLYTIVIFSGPLLFTFAYLNTVAIAYRSTMALPFGTIVIVMLLWVLLTIPGTIVGSIFAKRSQAEFKAPCKPNIFARVIPDLPWYRRGPVQLLLAGVLPFSGIYLELYYICASIFGYKVYTIYSLLSVVFVMLLLVTAFTCVAIIYFQLVAEDYRWWWRSVLCGGSTALFIFAYSVYYFTHRSAMNGFLQTCFYFGYMGLACWAFFLLLGTVGFRASRAFVHHIYASLKLD